MREEITEIGLKPKNLYFERNKFSKIKEKKLKLKRGEERIMGVCLILLFIMFISMANIYSARFYNAGMRYADFEKHIMYLVISVIVFFISIKIDYHIYNNKKMVRVILFAASTVFSLMYVLADKMPKIVPRINGATGWIRIAGIGFQPSEMFKILFIIVMAYRFNLSEKKNYKDLKIITKNIVPPALFILFLLSQNDLGTLIHYMSIYLFMLFMTKISGIYIAWVSAVGGVTGILGMLYIYFGDFTNAGYKVQRIKSFLVGLISNYYDSDKGYQVKQSLIGIGSGGLFGKGYGNGIQKYSYLPEIHTDFIFTSFSEEIGFIGVLILTSLMVALYNRITRTAVECDDYFGKYLATGVAGYIFIQFLINVSVAMGILPVFGIPMPFMSFGGSSLVGVFWSLGMVISINKLNNLKIRQSIEQDES